MKHGGDKAHMINDDCNAQSYAMLVKTAVTSQEG